MAFRNVIRLMANISVRVENLGKQYRIGAKRKHYPTLREALSRALVSPLRKARDGNETIWALKNVTFKVNEGEVVGIIGRNGAGKSTLLKILSRITEPTEGCAEIRGRVGSLLEVGTGFHPELTGRENAYLNGVMLGMRKTEIERRFDEIVAFAQMEKFLDTPVKHYSSGMYLRLAFAVAAHLKSEILLVDEVLAVGDAQFQKKCLGKIGDVAREGRTVLLVSHNMAAIESLCSRALLLDEGKIMAAGRTRDVIGFYLDTGQKLADLSLAERKDRLGNGHLRFTRLAFYSDEWQEVEHIAAGEAVTIALDYECPMGKPLEGSFAVKIALADSYGYPLFSCFTTALNQDFSELPPAGRVLCSIPSLPLLPGAYSVMDLWCKVDGVLVDRIQQAGRLSVIAGDYFGSGKLTDASSGPMLVKHSWQLGHENMMRPNERW